MEATFAGVDGASAGAAEPSRTVRHDVHGKTTHLCTGSRARILRCSGGPRDHAKRARLIDYRFSSLILGIVKSTPFQMRRVGIMIVTKDGTAAAHVPARHERDTGIATAGRDDSGPHGGSNTAATAVRRLGFVYIPMGTHQPLWMPRQEGRITELSPILSSLTPRIDQMTVLSNLQLKNAYSAGPTMRPPMRVLERCPREENGRQRLRAWDDGRPDRCQADQHRDSASVARARDGLQLRRRQLRQRLRVCLHEHDGVVDVRRRPFQPKQIRASYLSACSAMVER